MLGSFYYGYMVLQIPGGYFAMKYGGTKIFGVAVFLASILTLLTPVATRYSVWALVVLRILEGLVLVSMMIAFFLSRPNFVLHLHSTGGTRTYRLFSLSLPSLIAVLVP